MTTVKRKRNDGDVETAKTAALNLRPKRFYEIFLKEAFQCYD